MKCNKNCTGHYQKKLNKVKLKDQKIFPPYFKIKKQNWFMLLLARILGTWVVGVDYAKSSDKTVRIDGFFFRGKTYITKIKEEK